MPEARAGDPDKVSDPTSAPAAVENVSVGDASPYVIVLSSAVTVMGLALIVRFAGTRVTA